MIPRRFCIESSGKPSAKCPSTSGVSCWKKLVAFVQWKVPVNEAKINKIRAAFLGSPRKSTNKPPEIKHATIDSTQFCYLTSDLIQTSVVASYNSPRQTFSLHIMLCCSCKTERRRANVYSQKCVRWQNVFHLPAHVNRHNVKNVEQQEPYTVTECTYKVQFQFQYLICCIQTKHILAFLFSRKHCD